MSTPPISRELCEQIQEARRRGLSVKEIGRQFGISHGPASEHSRGICNHPEPLHTPQTVTAKKTEVLTEYEEHRLKIENAELRKQLREYTDRRVVDDSLAALIERVSAHSAQPPTWLSPSRPQNRDKAIATFLFSDWHFDEVVKPEQVEYYNEYNREIATKRLKVYFENCVKLARDHISGVDIEGIVFAMAGDIFSGDIHDELKETNESTICESLLYWLDLMVSGIRMLADEFGRVSVPVVVGNHGRMSRKPKAKNRPQENFDWLFGHMIAREFSRDDRVTFTVSESADCRYSIYNTAYLLTHLDQFRGGSGISGSKAPLLLGAHRKLKREMAMNRRMDVMIGGHWHELEFLGNVIKNGSGKGYDEYAFQGNFNPEPPQQAFWLTQPDHGVTICAPVHCQAPDERYPEP